MTASRLVYAQWIAAVTYLTVTAFGTKRDTRPHLGQSFALLFALIAAFVLPRLPLFRFLNYAPVHPLLRVLGVATTSGGLALLIAGRQTLGRNWSQTVSAKEAPELVTAGPYSLVRHPMYGGGLIAALGSAVVVGGPFVFMSVLLGALFGWRVGAEDRLMAEQFPDAYPAYQRRTRALIPYVL